jgi:hypothetical protein
MKLSLGVILLASALPMRAQTTTLGVTAAEPLPHQYARIVPDVRDGFVPLLRDSSIAARLLGTARQFNATIFRRSLVVLVNVPMTVRPPCPLANAVLLNAVQVDAITHRYETGTVIGAVRQVPWRVGCVAANANYGSPVGNVVRVVAERLLLEADYGLAREQRYALHTGSGSTIPVRALEASRDRKNPGTYLGPLHGTAFPDSDWTRIRSGKLKLTIEGVADGAISQGGGR